jgi:hypothetical protein
MAGTSQDKPGHDGAEKWFNMTGNRSRAQKLSHRWPSRQPPAPDRLLARTMPSGLGDGHGTEALAF